MKKTKSLFIMAVLALVMSLPAVGFSESSVADGERLGKTCAGCHGTFGNTPGEYVGKIGGQNVDYLKKVLNSFSKGERPGSVEMTIVAKGYTEAQLNSIAMYYAAQKWVNSTNMVNPELVEAGKSVAAENGCMDCHGENGEGMDEYPRLGGQNKGYLIEVMKRYKAGQIDSDEMGMMPDLSTAEIKVLANYLSSLR